MMKTNKTMLELLAKDLRTGFPRSPHEKLGGFVIAARALDKCRATLSRINGEYHFDCPLDNQLFDFAGVTGKEFKEFVKSGADDDDVAAWIKKETEHLSSAEIIVWNNRMRETRIGDLPENLQVFLEDYIPQFVPRNRRVYTWFDVYDLEEQRI